MSQRTMRTVAGRAFALLVAGLVVVVLALIVVVPKLGGGTAYTILTGSMAPDLPTGTVVVVRDQDPGTIRVGDVVTYQITSGQPAVATHRVRSVSISVSGERQFTTQGDANSAADPRTVQPVQIRGVLWYAVPYLGLPMIKVGGDVRQVVVTGAVLVLLGYAALSFLGSARDHRRRRQDSPASTIISEDNDLLTTTGARS